MSDAELTIDPSSGFYDFTIGEDGDIKTVDFFDTAILYSIFGERRATKEEVLDPVLRRGWIGNEEFENGSKLWQYRQARLTRSVINSVSDEARFSLEWLVSDGLAVSIDEVQALVKNNSLVLSITIRRSLDNIERRLYTLWENTGNATR